MSSGARGTDWYARTLRAWQLAILRFGVTLDNADRLAVLAIAREIDRLDPRHDGNGEFAFFRRTSAVLCAAIQAPGEPAAAVLRQYLERIDDGRLKRVFAAAIEADQPASLAGKPVKPAKREKSLWRGLSSRGDRLPRSPNVRGELPNLKAGPGHPAIGTK